MLWFACFFPLFLTLFTSNDVFLLVFSSSSFFSSVSTSPAGGGDSLFLIYTWYIYMYIYIGFDLSSLFLVFLD